MRYWGINDTRDWIVQVQMRLEDMDFYLKETIRYCETRGIIDNVQVLVLSIMTCIWVSTMRNEPISICEVADILGLDNLSNLADKTYTANDHLSLLDFEQMLDMIVDKGPFFKH